MYVYRQETETTWCVGYYRPNETFAEESEHKSERSAAKRVAWLNGMLVLDAIKDTIKELEKTLTLPTSHTKPRK